MITSKLHSVIVDDERAGINGLQTLLERCSDQVTVIGSADSLLGGESLIREKTPDLVFLDVQFPEGTGFDLLDRFPNRNFQVVFVTAYDQYAIKAIRLHASDYLLKPISFPELQEAVNFVCKQAEPLLLPTPLQMQPTGGFAEKLAVPTSGGFDYIPINEILYLEADGMYTAIHLLNSQRIVVSKTLSRFEQSLESKGFLRIHRSFLVSFNYIQRINRNNGCSVVMSNGEEIPIPFKNRRAMVNHINRLSNIIE